ncbi:MAG: hypothetical protein LBC09_02005 [Helicobacteraceae bacterium]|jgi:hypothetical protein|nr:hypothetical protein [Helicobacteraceae bacterium]
MNGRSFISVSLFIFIVTLFATGLIIEVGETIGEAAFENEADIPSYLLFIMSFITATHVISGVCFAVLSIFHIRRNWNALKNCLKTKSGALALIWVAIVISIALLVALLKTQ